LFIFELRDNISFDVLFSNLAPTNLKERILKESRKISIVIDTLVLQSISSSFLIKIDDNISCPIVLQNILSWSYIEILRIAAFYFEINLGTCLVCYI